VPDDAIDLAAGCGVVPTVHLAQQEETGAWATVVAVKPAIVLVVEPKAGLAAAHRARPLPSDEESVLDTEPQQDLPPAPAGAIDGGRHYATLAFSTALAYLITRERI
jgi:hypothetical protein